MFSISTCKAGNHRAEIPVQKSEIRPDSCKNVVPPLQKSWFLQELFLQEKFYTEIVEDSCKNFAYRNNSCKINYMWIYSEFEQYDPHKYWV